MERENRTEKQIINDIRAAGKSFLGMRMGDLLNRINELEKPELKKKLIEEYYENQAGTFDSKIGGTTTRVNSAIRIIKADRVVEVLEQIDESDKRVKEEAVIEAKKTLDNIRNGKLKLPVLE